MRSVALVSMLALLISLAGCATAESVDPDSEWGMSGPLSPTPELGRLDVELRRGLLVETDTTRTQVWTARNRWEDTDTPVARAAGLAWPASSGLTWDAKFSAWVASLAWIPSVDGFSTTVQLTTPWGKTLPSPMLECAETSLFLRITFAAWYELPLMLETQDGHGHLVYFGHNGVRTATGRYAQSPEFAIQYKDYTASSDGRTSWPSDPVLRGKRILGQVAPEQQRTELLAQIADARHHLAQFPASCSARDRREQAFAALYALSARAFGQTPAEVDAAYRQLDDYVFAQLDYPHARTCCWDSSTSAMYGIVMDAARADLAAAQAAHTCAAPVVFKSRADGYQRWADRAAALGRATDWRPGARTRAARSAPSRSMPKRRPRPPRTARSPLARLLRR